MRLSLFALVALAATASALPAPAPRGILGGEASLQYVNVLNGRIRTWGSPDGSKTPVPTDAAGWPLADAQGVIFDDRPSFAWAPPMDDPQKRQEDYSGVWRVELTGYADMSISTNSGCKGVTMLNQTYDPEANRMTGYLQFAKGDYPEVANLLVIDFVNTRQNATAANNTGFTGLRVIRKGYLDRSMQLFTDEWATTHAPFDHLRFMGVTGTNSYTWQCGGPDAFACSVIEWTDRQLPIYPLDGSCKGCMGAPWEHVVLAANELQKDIWINIPVTASSPTVKGNYTPSDPKQTYVYQLADLLKNGNKYTNYTGLDPKLNIFIEHSNEVWNFGFKQYSLNQAAAEAEVEQTQGKSNLASSTIPGVNCTYEPGASKQPHAQCWGHRRHARRVYEIGQVFEEVFGKGSLNSRIRMVYASWTIFPQEYFNNTLSWLAKTHGDIDKYIYAISPTGYFAPDKSWVEKYDSMTPDAIAKLFYEAATNNTNSTLDFVALKKMFNVKLATYEAGPGDDVGGQFSKPGPALSNFILANRDAAMKPAVLHSVKDVYWGNGGDIYHQFSIEGKCSRFGCWGAQEFYTDPPSPKYSACLELLGKTQEGVLQEVAGRTPALEFWSVKLD